MVAKQCVLMLNQFISAFTFDVVRFIVSKIKYLAFWGIQQYFSFMILEMKVEMCKYPKLY